MSKLSPQEAWLCTHHTVALCCLFLLLPISEHTQQPWVRFLEAFFGGFRPFPWLEVYRRQERAALLFYSGNLLWPKVCRVKKENILRHRNTTILRNPGKYPLSVESKGISPILWVQWLKNTLFIYSYFIYLCTKKEQQQQQLTHALERFRSLSFMIGLSHSDRPIA